MGLKKKLRHRMKFLLLATWKTWRVETLSGSSREGKVCAESCKNGKWHLVGLPQTLQRCSVAVSMLCLFRGNQDRIGIKCQMGCNAFYIPCSSHPQLTFKSISMWVASVTGTQGGRGGELCVCNFTYLLPLYNTWQARAGLGMTLINTSSVGAAVV